MPENRHSEGLSVLLIMLVISLLIITTIIVAIKVVTLIAQPFGQEVARPLVAFIRHRFQHLSVYQKDIDMFHY
mgnify:CR=1 FL=1